MTGVASPASSYTSPTRRLAADAGYTVRCVCNAAAILSDVEAAETILKLRRKTPRAVTAGYLTSHDAHAWAKDLATGAFSSPPHIHSPGAIRGLRRARLLACPCPGELREVVPNVKTDGYGAA